MKILHVVPTYLPAWRYGGPIFAVHGLCRALAARGHEVHVFTTNVDGPGTLDVPTDLATNVEGVQVHYFPVKFRRIYWSSRMLDALDSEAGSFDLIHSHAVYLWPGIAAARAARKLRVPFVISPRGMLVPELISRKSRIPKLLWLRLLESRAFSHASAIHFTSQLEEDDAKRTGVPLPRTFIVPNGIDLPPLPSGVKRQPRTLLFLGRITWKKGLERIIQALPAVGARLIVAGNDEEDLTPRLRELASSIGADVEFVGPLYNDAKLELLASATLFVLLSSSENFGNSVIEALAMGTPVVLSKEVGVADEIVRAGAGVIGLDELASLLDDPARRAAMGHSGRRLVESRFTWSRVSGEMEAAYGAVARQGAGDRRF